MISDRNIIHEGVIKDIVDILTDNELVNRSKILNDNKPQRYFNSISKATANKWLSADLIKCEKKLDTHLPWWRNVSVVRQAALLDMTYNMGIDKLKTFKQFLHHMQKQNYTQASRCLDGSRWSKQVGVRSREIRHAIKHDKWVAMKK